MFRIIRRLIVGSVLIPVVYLAWTTFTVWQTSRMDERGPADAIVVMGAAQYNGQPSLVFKARLDHAKKLYEQQVAPLIVVLGGKREGDRFTEAQAGAAYLEQDLPIDKVTGVKAGSTTLDSIQKFTGLAKQRGIRKIVIVSDPLHLARSREMAKDQGFEVAVSGSDLSQSRDLRRTSLARETMNLLFYRVFGE